jgi:hypothetical protein
MTYMDPTGLSTQIDENSGKIISGYNDGDNGVYAYPTYEGQVVAGPANYVGETTSPDYFVNSEYQGKDIRDFEIGGSGLYGTLTVNQNAIEGSNTLQYTSDLLFSGGYGIKLALVLGLGIEGGAMVDKNLNIYLYFTGSIGVGIETPATTKTDLSTGKYLAKSKGRTVSLSVNPNQIGFTSATTADICLGVIGTYDLNNLKSSGLPNSYSFGSVGGGIWKSGTVILPVFTRR